MIDPKSLEDYPELMNFLDAKTDADRKLWLQERKFVNTYILKNTLGDAIECSLAEIVADKGKLDHIKTLLDAKKLYDIVELNKMDMIYKPLIYAARRGHMPIVQHLYELLLQKGEKGVELTTTILQEAINHKQRKVVDYLLKDSRYVSNEKYKQNFQVFLKCAIMSGDEDIQNNVLKHWPTPKQFSVHDKTELLDIATRNRGMDTSNKIFSEIVALYEQDFTTAFQQLNQFNASLQKKTDKKYDKVKMVLNSLVSEIDALSKKDPDIPLDNIFYQDCIDKINNIDKEVARHRGFGSFSPIARAMIGALALLSIVPALIVAVRAKHGFMGTFFAHHATNTKEILDTFKATLESIKEDVEANNKPKKT